jgi:O-antigen/teichoic acid export membrane protein
MRFTALAVINVVSLVVGAAIAIAGAEAGYGYWALVAMSIASTLATTFGVWLVTGWIPMMPRRRTGIRSMMHFGGAITFTSIVSYIAYNTDKVLIGRFWGAEAIGIYGRAYYLVSVPIDNVHNAVADVVFSTLSRLQDDPVRLKTYFLKGLSLVFGLMLLGTIACALFADDVVFVVLGPKWADAAAIVRLLAPTIGIIAIIYPLGGLLYAIGLVARSLKMALALAPLLIIGYVIALPYGPKGVAFAYSAVMTLWLIPYASWCVHGTPISLWDILSVVSRPLASGVVAGGVAFGVQLMCGQFFPVVVRLVLESSVLVVTFFAVLLFAAGQKSLYLDLLRGMRGPSSDTGNTSGSAQIKRT